MKSIQWIVCMGMVMMFTGCAAKGPIVPEQAWCKQVATGYAFTEGPAFHEAGIYFTDIPNNKIIRYHTLTETTEDFRENTGAANGLMFDGKGSLYICEGGNRRVTKLDLASGETTVLAESYEGKKLNSPNDISLDKHGGFYFTDPRYGPRDNMEMKIEGVYYVDRDGGITRVIDDLTRPNGVILSPDGKTLYVADNAEKTLWAYHVDKPGKLSGGQVLAWMDPNGRGGGDGMTIDQDGNIYCTGQGHIWIWNPKGVLLHRIQVPEEPANVAFAGKGSGTLYITARSSLYMIQTNGKGVR